MANNYLEFSEVIDNLTPEEMRWWQTQIDNSDNKVGEDTYLDCNACVEKDNQLVWFKADEYGDIDIISETVQEFLQKFRPNDFFTLTWSCTCSKPRVGEFSGGGLFVTASEMKFFSMSKWVEQVKREWRDNQ